ncbi:hypothetical protein ACFLS4_05495 [Bacteroidota bacterium]
MKSKIVLFLVFGFITLTIYGQTSKNLEIIEPKDQSLVGQRPIVKGVLTESNFDVWIIVHPLEVSDFWVQPKAGVKADSTWKAMIHIGRPGSVDIGKLFEIKAFAGVEIELYEGKVLNDWPKAKYSSQLIEVTRE